MRSCVERNVRSDPCSQLDNDFDVVSHLLLRTPNTTLVVGTSNLESATVTPLLIPRIGNQPIVFTILGSPSKQLDSISIQLRSRCVLVHTALVCWEVCINSDCCSRRSILNHVSLKTLR